MRNAPTLVAACGCLFAATTIAAAPALHIAHCRPPEIMKQ